MASQGETHLNATKDMQISADNNFSAQISNGPLQIQTAQNDLRIQTDANLIFHSRENGTAILGQPAGGIILTPAGNVLLQGSQVKLEAEEINIYGTSVANHGASAKYVPPPQLQNASEQDKKKKNKEDEFKLFVATVYGEALNSYQGPNHHPSHIFLSTAAWQAVASVIMNRVHTYPYKDGGHPNSVQEVIEKTGFDAYDQKNEPYTEAMNFMNAHPGWVENPDKFDKRIVPDGLYDLRKAVGSIYLKQKPPTTNATDYFSPRSQDWSYKHKHEQYSKSAEEVRNNYKKNGYHQVIVAGMLPTDDLEFYAR